MNAALSHEFYFSCENLLMEVTCNSGKSAKVKYTKDQNINRGKILLCWKWIWSFIL